MAKEVEEPETDMKVAVSTITVVGDSRTAKLGLEACNRAAEVKVRAERKTGEFLARIERNPGERTDLTSFYDETRLTLYEAVLQENKIPRSIACRWQQLAGMSEPEFEQHIKETRDERSITTSRVIRLITKFRDSNRTHILPEGRFDVIYADPPWEYDFSATATCSIESHYSTLSVGQICRYKDSEGTPIQDEFTTRRQQDGNPVTTK